MANYNLYGKTVNAMQKDMVSIIKAKYTLFRKEYMSLACNSEKTALQLIPAAEELLADALGAGPGLSISPSMNRHTKHDNKNKPNRLCVRVGNDLRSRIQAVYEQMCFASMQDLIEAALAQFVDRYEVKQ